jgi:glycosyltransferase involved in cell wall biosynthesis
MRILYCAIDQVVPGTNGGSVHVRAVAEGLAALGHDVHVLVSPGDAPFPCDGVRWIPMSPPLHAHQLRWARARAVRRLAEQLRPDVVMERYYNFAGEGIGAGSAVGATTVLEVNAPVIDHPGSAKATLDRALILRPMKRWRERICESADLIVTPSRSILPPATPTAKLVLLEWGADTDRFRPDARGPVPFARPEGTIAIFAGAFRRWHGAIHLVRAIRVMRERHHHGISAILVGDGPELTNVRTAARGLDNVSFTGAVPHEQMPAALAAADVGVAPFDVTAHKPLALGFYWSPLKIFEYMAAGLPIVAPAIERIASLVSHNREGILYKPATPEALADALHRLHASGLRERLGRAARERAVRDYSWRAHCEALAAAILRVRRAPDTS